MNQFTSCKYNMMQEIMRSPTIMLQTLLRQKWKDPKSAIWMCVSRYKLKIQKFLFDHETDIIVLSETHLTEKKTVTNFMTLNIPKQKGTEVLVFLWKI